MSVPRELQNDRITERKMAGLLLGRTIRFKSVNPRLPNHYIVANPRNLSLLEIPDGAFTEWSEFNVVPGLSGSGISFQSKGDKNSFLFSSETRLSIYKVPVGVTPPERAAAEYTQWLPTQPRTGQEMVQPIPGSPGQVSLQYATFKFEQDPATIMLQQQLYLVNGISNDSELAIQDSTWEIEDADPQYTLGTDPQYQLTYEWVLVGKYPNDTSVEQSSTLTFQRGIEVSSSESTSQEVALGFSFSASYDYGLIGATFEANFGLTIANSITSSFTRNETVTSTHGVTVPPQSVVTVWQPCMIAKTPVANIIVRSGPDNFLRQESTAKPTADLPGEVTDYKKVPFGRKAE